MCVIPSLTDHVSDCQLWFIRYVIFFALCISLWSIWSPPFKHHIAMHIFINLQNIILLTRYFFWVFFLVDWFFICGKNVRKDFSTKMIFFMNANFIYWVFRILVKKKLRSKKSMNKIKNLTDKEIFKKWRSFLPFAVIVNNEWICSVSVKILSLSS